MRVWQGVWGLLGVWGWVLVAGSAARQCSTECLQPLACLAFTPLMSPMQGMPGLSFGKLEHKMGWRSQPTAAIC